MTSHSIRAYDLPSSVASFDADMDLMHPNRYRMADLIAEIIEDECVPSVIVDLGTGTGFLMDRLLARFPKCRAIGLDGAANMVAKAESRLGPRANRAEFRIGHFRDLSTLCANLPPVDAVVSAFALHHLVLDEKLGVLRMAKDLLRPGAWFLNADLTLGEDDYIDGMIRRLRVRDLVNRTAGQDTRFADAESTNQFLDELTKRDHDQFQRPSDDLRILREAGFAHVSTFWKDTGKVVYGGMRPLQ